jgi:uncharacterized protein (TIGR03435 family)
VWTPLLIFVVSVTTRLSLAQSAPTDHSRLEFEVASIKLNKSSDRAVRIGAKGGRFTAINFPLQMLITRAYKISDLQFTGAPKWLSSDRYDIEAKAEGDPSPEAISAMLQSLFEERLQLKYHREFKEMAIYALVVKKAGKLKASEGECVPGTPSHAVPSRPETPVIPCGRATTTAGHLLGAKIEIGQLVKPLSELSGRIVRDETNLTGKYDINVEYTPERSLGLSPNSPANSAAIPQAPDPGGPSLFDAIEEKLGLKLELKNEPVEIMVIDHVERPAEN